MHGLKIKKNVSYYVSEAICAIVNQFDYLHKKELTTFPVGHYTFKWCYRPDHPDSQGWLFAGDTKLVRFLNTYVSPWLKVANE